MMLVTDGGCCDDDDNDSENGLFTNPYNFISW